MAAVTPPSDAQCAGRPIAPVEKSHAGDARFARRKAGALCKIHRPAILVCYSRDRSATWSEGRIRPQRMNFECELPEQAESVAKCIGLAL